MKKDDYIERIKCGDYDHANKTEVNWVISDHYYNRCKCGKVYTPEMYVINFPNKQFEVMLSVCWDCKTIILADIEEIEQINNN